MRGEPSSWPREKPRLLVAWLLFVGAFLVISLCMVRSITLYDEGVILTGASEVARGALPHRDFYANYGPAPFYVLSLWFKLFGASVLTERIWDAVLKAGVTAMVYLVSSRLMSARWALINSALALIWLSLLNTPGYPVWAAMLLSLVSLSSLISVVEGDRRRVKLVVAGISVGLLTLFRYDIGFFACASQSIVLVTYSFDETGSGNRARAAIERLLVFWAGVALIFLPAAVAGIVAGGLSDFVFDVILFPRHYSEMRALPWPAQVFTGLSTSITEYIVYLPFAAFLGATAALISPHYFSRTPPDRESGGDPMAQRTQKWELALLAAVLIAFNLEAFVRVSAVHSAMALIPSFIILGMISSAYALHRPPLVAIALGIAAPIWVIPSARATVHLVVAAKDNINWWRNHGCMTGQYLDRAACFELEDKDAKAIQYLRSRVSVGDEVFIGLSRHDKIYANDVGLYFISGFRPATKWYHFDPGLQNSKVIQLEIIEDLERTRPAYSILNSEWENWQEPNASGLSSGVFILDDYIRSHYRPVASFESLQVLQRIPEPQKS